MSDSSSSDDDECTAALPLPGPSVLIIDDFELSVQLLRCGLTKMQGAACTVAASAAEALRILQERNTPFDLILCDMCLPGMDGAQFSQTVRRLEQQKQWPAQKLIVISADEQYRAAALAAGSTAFVSKFGDFFSSICSHLKPAKPNAP